MKRKLIFIFSFSLMSFFATAQEITDSIKWITIDQAGELFTTNQKPVLIFLYKQKNYECEKMQTETFSNSEVANYINILYYPVKINIETKEKIRFFDGNLYENKTGIHNLAKMFIGTNDSLPALVLFSRRAQGNVFFGYKDRDEIFRHLIYYAEDMDLSLDFAKWHKIHTKGYPAGQSQIMTRLIIRWKEIGEASELNKTEPRKTLLNFYNYYKTSCTLMRTQTYNQPVIAKYLNEKYYPVNIDVFSQDTLEFFGIKYFNENQPHKYHQLPIEALGGKMIFPAFIILDENGKVLDKIQMFMTPEMIEPVLKYYGDNFYKNISYAEFIKNFKSEIAP